MWRDPFFKEIFVREILIERIYILKEGKGI
jgi:hypothetical protein